MMINTFFVGEEFREFSIYLLLYSGEMAGSFEWKLRGTQGKFFRLNPEDYKSCLEKNKLEKEINLFEKNKLDTNILKRNHQEFLKNNRLILNSLPRFRREKHNIFTE